MEKKQNVPALRFQGFSGEWERKSLGDIVEIVMGQSPDGSNYFNKPCGKILVQGNADIKDGWVVPRIWTTQITKVAKAGDLIMSVRAPAGEMGRTAYDVVLGRGVAAIKGNDFIYHLLVNLNQKGYWKNFAAGSTFESLNADNIRQAVVGITGLMEQNEIGGFFENIDREISSVQRKIRKFQQFRQAMLAKLFPREGAAEPELRFRGFSGKWKLRRLSDFVKEVTRVDASSHAPVMMITAANGFINQSERYSFDNSGQSLQKYILLKQGELAYNHGASKLRPFGSCFVLREKEARVPFVYHCFSVTDNYADFVALELNGNFVERQLRRIVSSSARMDGLLNISFEEYCTVKIALPCQEEQRKIGNFFRNLDTYISLQQKKLERMQRLKAALLEKLFV